MMKFAALLLLTILLIGAWLVTLAPLSITPPSYLDMTVPWWHIVLHGAWVASLSVTVFTGLYLAWALRLP